MKPDQIRESGTFRRSTEQDQDRTEQNKPTERSDKDTQVARGGGANEGHANTIRQLGDRTYNRQQEIESKIR